MRKRKPNSKAESGKKKLRRQAESMVRASPADISSMTEEETQHLVYELQVHQVELELQNEELREAQMELAAARDRFADLYDFAPMGYLTLDRAGRVVEANLTVATLLGIRRSELLGAVFSDFVAPDYQDTAYLHWQEVFSSARRQVCELELQRGDNCPLTVRLESMQAHNAAGSAPLCWVGLLDIGDLKGAREALHSLNEELEQRVQDQVGEIRVLANAIASLGEGVLITRDQRDWLGSRIEFVNAALCRMVGYTAQEMIGQSPAMLLCDDMDSTAIAELDSALATDKSFRGELLYQTKDGERRDMGLYITPLHEADRRYTRYVAVHRDITESKQAQFALFERKERLRSILNAARDVIVTIDRAGIVQDCNLAIEKVFGYSRDDILGRNISMLMPSGHREKHDGYLRRYLQTKQAHIIGTSREMQALHRDGHTFPVSLAVEEMADLGLYTGIISDIGELRRLQREVLRAAGQVQWQIGQALHDGPQQTLAGLSLTARSLALDLKRSDTPDAAAAAAAAARLAEELSQANRDIRSLAQGLVPVGLGRGGLMEALADLAQRTSQDHGLAVDFVCPRPIRIDDDFMADQLYLIAQEAILNAVNHARADHVFVRLERQGQGQAVSLRVQDNGVGFDRSGVGGTGLGLHIMPYRAATIGGSLAISDMPGGGTQVSCVFDLPGGAAGFIATP
ncbi:MAG: PAS domain S-box protein [Halieaceae bacterium]|jgi:two-component system CheB/CheR fusion protein|nr:PAS domain S-box protein [Halieaceae bacterium]